MKEDKLNKLYKICEGLDNRFGNNKDHFRILARLTDTSN